MRMIEERLNRTWDAWAFALWSLGSVECPMSNREPWSAHGGHSYSNPGGWQVGKEGLKTNFVFAITKFTVLTQ